MAGRALRYGHGEAVEATMSGVPRGKSDGLPPGITLRPSGRYQAQARVNGQTASRTFDKQTQAKRWKRDAEAGMARGEIVKGDSPRFRSAAEMFLAGARDGTIRTRSRSRYRPKTIKRYELALRSGVYLALDGQKLHEINRGQLQVLVGQLQAQGYATNTVRNTLMPVQAIFRWAVMREWVHVDPTANLELPLDRSKRDKITPPTEIKLRLDLLEPKDRPVWATGFYAGLRLGEITRLRWDEVDLANGKIHVTDFIDETKTEAGERAVPILPVLRDLLLEHKMRADPRQPLVFCRRSVGGIDRGPDGPFAASGVYARASRRWGAQGLPKVTLHDARHTYASILIASGENPKTVQTYMGHSSIETTFDRYGHLFPGGEQASADRIQAYLDKSLEDERERTKA